MAAKPIRNPTNKEPEPVFEYIARVPKQPMVITKNIDHIAENPNPLYPAERTKIKIKIK